MSIFHVFHIKGNPVCAFAVYMFRHTDREAFYMQGGGVMAIPELDITGSGKKSQEDDLIPSKKKRKRKSGPDFSL